MDASTRLNDVVDLAFRVDRLKIMRFSWPVTSRILVEPLCQVTDVCIAMQYPLIADLLRAIEVDDVIKIIPPFVTQQKDAFDEDKSVRCDFHRSVDDLISIALIIRQCQLRLPFL